MSGSKAPYGELVVAQTRAWVEAVVVGENFCPFARREVVNNRIRYVVSDSPRWNSLLDALLDEYQRLDVDNGLETTLVIYPSGLDDFHDYLEFVAVAEGHLQSQGYEGIYQLASFHPGYQFADSPLDDPANYTNRSPYPTLHIIREETIARVLASIDDPEAIPERNIRHARQLGLNTLQQMLLACLKHNSDNSS